MSSVQKLTIRKAISNYTIILNKVLQGMSNYDALGLYCYLISLPDGWQFHKCQLAEHGKIGRDKLDKLLKILRDRGLIDYGQARNDEGRYTTFYLDVLDGTNFIINDIPPVTEKPLTENQGLVNRSYKRNKIKYILKTKDIPNIGDCDSSKRRATASPLKLKPVPSDFKLTTQHHRLAAEGKLDVEVEKEKFIDHFKGTGEKRANWLSSFNNWLRKAKEFKEKLSVRKKSSAEGFSDFLNSSKTTGVTLDEYGNTIDLFA